MRRLSALLGLALSFTTAAIGAPFAYITNQGSHDVSVIDLAQQRVVATVPVGRSPAGVVAAGGRAFISNPDSRDISVIDMASQTVVRTLQAGQGPVGIDAAPDGRRLFVADWYANELLVFDDTASTASTATKPSARIALGHAPAGVAAGGGDIVYVAERDDDSVAAVSLREGRVVARAKVGTHPFALLLDTPRQRLYALNVLSDDVSVIDLSRPGAMSVIATVHVGKAPYGAALAAGGTLLYVSNQHDDSVTVIDAATLAPLRTLEGFGYPEGIAAHEDKVYVVNWMDDAVSVLDAASGRELRRIRTGKNSRGFGAFIGAPTPP